jgi:hypothetical protein
MLSVRKCRANFRGTASLATGQWYLAKGESYYTLVLLLLTSMLWNKHLRPPILYSNAASGSNGQKGEHWTNFTNSYRRSEGLSQYVQLYKGACDYVKIVKSCMGSCPRATYGIRQ